MTEEKLRKEINVWIKNFDQDLKDNRERIERLEQDIQSNKAKLSKYFCNLDGSNKIIWDDQIAYNKQKIAELKKYVYEQHYKTHEIETKALQDNINELNGHVKELWTTVDSDGDNLDNLEDVLQDHINWHKTPGEYLDIPENRELDKQLEKLSGGEKESGRKEGVVLESPPQSKGNVPSNSKPLEDEIAKIIQIIEIYDNGHENEFEPKEYFKRIREKDISEFLDDLDTIFSNHDVDYKKQKWQEVRDNL